MTKHDNEKRRDVHYKVDEWVYLKSRSYYQSSLSKHKHLKLAPQFIGPYQIIANVGLVAYRGALPLIANIHLVFHVLVLRMAVEHTLPIMPIPPELASDLTVQLQSTELSKITFDSWQIGSLNSKGKQS